METLNKVTKLLKEPMSKLTQEQMGQLISPIEVIRYYFCYTYAESMFDETHKDLTWLLMGGEPIIDISPQGLNDELECLDIEDYEAFTKEIMYTCFSVESGEGDDE